MPFIIDDRNCRGSERMSLYGGFLINITLTNISKYVIPVEKKRMF